MTDEKWQETLELIKQNYQMESEESGTLEDYENATFESVVFTCPLGKFKFIRTKKPRVLDKKTTFSNRVGSSVKVDYQYSKDEFVDNLEILKWEDMEQDWVKAKFNL
jgi:hypothetical protein